MQARARSIRSGPRPNPVIASPPPPAPCPGKPTVILGIDPSLRGTGWGVIRIDGRTPVALASGTLRCPASLARSRCLVRIADGLREAIRLHAPTTCAIEALFFAQNLQTALLMGEARGACLLAAAEAGLDIHELAPRKVKLAIVGFGGAQKTAVARMVQRLLHLPDIPDPDAADALAVALAHSRELSRFTRSLSRSRL
ncbi:MAG: crossover junction endodeoxyribonuclease RuvC [Verrucomicrobiae bacterium]|nr:crossover junction endodeoxyribonuclease RuvC [Verrucomicrobiae bacterium]